MKPEISNTVNIKGAKTSNRFKSTVRTNSWRIATDLPSSFRYAAQGVEYAFSCQRNFRIHVCFGFLAFVLGWLLGLSSINLAMLTLTATIVLVLELLNTALEAVVDLAVGRNFHPLAQIAKDCAAGAVLISSIASLIIAVLLFVPALTSYFGI